MLNAFVLKDISHFRKNQRREGDNDIGRSSFSALCFGVYVLLQMLYLWIFPLLVCICFHLGLSDVTIKETASKWKKKKELMKMSNFRLFAINNWIICLFLRFAQRYEMQCTIYWFDEWNWWLIKINHINSIDIFIHRVEFIASQNEMSALKSINTYSPAIMKWTNFHLKQFEKKRWIVICQCANNSLSPLHFRS